MRLALRLILPLAVTPASTACAIVSRPRPPVNPEKAFMASSDDERGVPVARGVTVPRRDRARLLQRS